MYKSCRVVWTCVLLRQYELIVIQRLKFEYRQQDCSFRRELSASAVNTKLQIYFLTRECGEH
jgi:hypothetical protein